MSTGGQGYCPPQPPCEAWHKRGSAPCCLHALIWAGRLPWSSCPQAPGAGDRGLSHTRTAGNTLACAVSVPSYSWLLWHLLSNPVSGVQAQRAPCRGQIHPRHKGHLACGEGFAQPRASVQLPRASSDRRPVGPPAYPAYLVPLVMGAKQPSATRTPSQPREGPQAAQTSLRTAWGEVAVSGPRPNPHKSLGHSLAMVLVGTCRIKAGALDLLRNYFRKEEVGVGGDGKGGPEKVHCR